MTALLGPGGRLVITGLDARCQESLPEDVAEVWRGFGRDDMRRWLSEAGLVNVFVTDGSRHCCATSQEGEEATVGIFLAVGTRDRERVRDAVRASYAARAEAGGSCCTAEASCGCDVPDYSAQELARLPGEATGMALGCGNPVAIASLQPGEVVLDIGSGGGIDVFLAARQVYPGGKAIGVDMTPAMLERAQATAKRMGFVNVEFRHGHAEALPVEEESVDVILSNCVINLSPDKGLVFQEAFRVLKPGGRLSVSDMVTDTSLPETMRSDPSQWAACIGGALPAGEYLDLIREAGFVAPSTSEGGVHHHGDGFEVYSLYVTAYKPPAPSVMTSPAREPSSDAGCG
jgi:SAM-dependent methyltransferase